MVTPGDVCSVLRCLPADDVRGIGLVVLRQPTRKQKRLTHRWGEIRWCVEFEGYRGPAIALDADDLHQPWLGWSRSLTPDDERELDRLRECFGVAEGDRRAYGIYRTPEGMRWWLLTRTVPHEVGHWVDYRRSAKRYVQRSEREVEEFANRYADRMQAIVERAIA